MHIFTKALDFIFPRFCPICAEVIKEERNVCGPDLEKIVLIRPPFCQCCGQPFNLTYSLDDDLGYICGNCREEPPLYSSARAIGPYEGVLKELIHKYKYEKKRFIYREFNRILIANADHLGLKKDKFNQVIPVPLHWKKVRERGFDQSFLIAKGVADYLHVPLDPNLLIRKRFTPPQINLDKDERKKNIRDAFHVKKTAGISNQKILLLDDVMTTGATISECCRVLINAGAKEIHVLTLARTI